jgi:acetoin utilization deacetylase AcuC-like enzyme
MICLLAKARKAWSRRVVFFFKLHARGYDLYSGRRIESEVERQNRLLREENAPLRRVLMAGGR